MEAVYCSRRCDGQNIPIRWRNGQDILTRWRDGQDILLITPPATIYSFDPSLISTTLGTYLSKIMIDSLMMAFYSAETCRRMSSISRLKILCICCFFHSPYCLQVTMAGIQQGRRIAFFKDIAPVLNRGPSTTLTR
jgi:hypothetical protein